MCKTIKQKVKFHLSPDRIYRLLIDSKLHSELTGQKATISKKVGGKFSTQGGRVTGINVDLVPGKRVVQAWRAEEFPPGIFSMAAFQLSPNKDGGTDLVLTHRGVPKDLIPGVEKDWRQMYWERIRRLQ
jgi:uncharacterized protein YndB with AHSA1/START domain